MSCQLTFLALRCITFCSLAGLVGEVRALDINENGLSDIGETGYASPLTVLGDPDEDGVSNLWEYRLNRNPLLNDGPWPLTSTTTLTSLTLAFPAPLSL